MKYIAYILLLGCLGEGEASQGSIREAPSQLPLVDNLQSATESVSDYSESTTIPQKAMLMQEETPAAPLLKKNGMYYYDLAQADSTDVVLDNEEMLKYGLEVSGVSVSPGGQCRTNTLMLRVSLRMDPIVATACTSLTSINITGAMDCGKLLGWMNDHFSKIINIQEVYCIDAKCYMPGTKDFKNYDLCKLERMRDHHDFVNSTCPAMCYCTWYQMENQSWVDVVCEDAHLNDSYLPKLPPNTKNLHISNNQIKCLKNLLHHYKDQKKLKRIVLERNQVASIPHLPLHMFRHLEYIDISYNNITELDVDVLRNLFTNKQLLLNLDENPIRCGCNLYHVNRYYMDQCGHVGERRCINSYGFLRCYSESENTTLPIWEMNNLESCITEPLIINWWLLLNIVLGLLNIIIIGLIIDILMIKRTKSSRRPKMDYMVGGLRHLWKLLRPEREEAERQSETEMFELNDANFQLRRANRCSTPTWRRSRYSDQ